MASNIAIQISANIQQAVAGIQSVNQKLDQLQQESERSRKSFTVVSAGFAAITTAAGTVANAIGAVVRAGQDLVTAFSAQELAERKLQTTLRATRNVIGMSVGELLELADAFSRASTYTDQEILAVEQMMIATRKISRETLPEATKAVLDMAAATGEDLTGAAQRLAQALSDPAGEIESLKEAGIQLSEEQKKNIQTVQEQNGIYEAQQILLEEVAGTYGDMAKAIADTDTGKLQQIKNVWEDIKEGLGEGLVNSISPALDQIYRQLCDISDWINGQNALTVASQYSPDLSEYSSEALRQARDAAKENLDKWEDWIFTDPKYIEEQKRAINNINSELSKRGYGPSEVRWIDVTDEEPNVAQEAPASAPPLPPPPVIPSSSSSFGPTFGPPRASYDGWWEGYGGLLYKQDNQYGINAGLLTAQVGIGKEYAEAYERDQARLARGPVSVPPIGSAPRVVFDGYLTAADGTLYKPNNMLGIDTGMMVSMAGIGKQYADAAVAEEARQKALEEARKRSAGAMGSFLDQYSGLSTTARVSELDDAIRASQSWMAEVDPDSTTYKMLKEINAALYEERNALLNTGEAGETAMDRLQKAFDEVDKYMQPILSIGDSFAQIMQNMADVAENNLTKIQEKWDEYFDDLEERQDRQSESLNAMLASGNISYEEYIDAMNGLDEERAKAEEEAAEEEEAARKKANELGKAAFIANQVNSIAEATMNIAQGVTEAIAQGGIGGITLGSIVAAAGAAQIAAIASQQYTPLAAGGIVTSPTRALIGEGGSPEAIVPLNEGNMERFGLSSSSGGVINLTINIGTVYSKDQLADEIFRGIERAQRTGALPKWRYA